MRLAACALVLFACDGNAELPDAQPGDPDAPPGCERPSLDAPWLDAQLAESIAELAATPRATTSERDDARTYLRAKLAANGWVTSLQSFAGGANVVAEVPATAAAVPRVIVGAHFDTVDGSPGANDNASGVAVVLALARYLKETPCRNAPVMLVMFDQEEVGLFGSRSFAQTLQPADVRAVHTIDQVAWDADGDRRFELEMPTPALEAEWRAAAAVVGVPVTTTTTEGTDHESFRDRGFAAVGLTEEYVGGDTSPHRHAPGDEASTVNVAYLALAAKLAAQVVLEEVAP